MPLQLPSSPSTGDQAWRDWASSLNGELERYAREQSQSPAALRAAAGISFVASPPLNLYVSKIGADAANSGFNSTTPCLTLAYALTLAREWNVERGNIVINLGDGTWAESIALAGPLWGAWQDNSFQCGQVVLNGNGAANTTLSGGAGLTYTVCASFAASIAVQNITLSGATGQSILFAQIGGLINVYGGVVFGAASFNQMTAEEHGDIEIWNSYTIAGGAATHWGVSQGGIVNVNPTGVTITLSGTPAFTNDFAFAQTGGHIHLSADTVFSGAATGRSYYAGSGGLITSYTSGAQHLPGNVAGIVQSGKVYPEGLLSATANTLTGITGLGTGSATVNGDSSSHCFVTLSPTGAPAAAGLFTINWMANRLLASGSGVPCVYSLNSGTGGWDQGATITGSANTAAFPPVTALTWKNNGVALTPGATYIVAIICQD